MVGHFVTGEELRSFPKASRASTTKHQGFALVWNKTVNWTSISESCCMILTYLILETLHGLTVSNAGFLQMTILFS